MAYYGQSGYSQDNGSAALVAEVLNLVPQRISATLRDLLYQIPMLQNVCNQLPESAAGGGWSMGFDGEVDDVEGVNQKLAEYENRLSSVPLGEEPAKDGIGIGTPRSISSLFKQAQVEANLHRGAVILVVAEDGEPSENPVNTKTIKTIRRLVVVSGNQIKPDIENGVDPINPIHYRLQTAFDGYGNADLMAQQSTSDLIHHSRVIRFDGYRLSAEGMARNDGWGISKIEAILPSYLRYIRSLNAAAKSVENHQLLVLKIKDLHDSLRRNRQSKLEERLTFNKMMMELMGAIALDADGEDLTFVNTTFTGLDSILDVQRDLFIGESNIPHDRLFGESPSGMGATGENERNNWADNVSDFQQNEWDSLLRKLYNLVWYAKDGPTKGTPPVGWKILYKAVVDRTMEEKTSLQSAQSESDVKYLEAGIITKSEARSRLSSPGYEAGLILNDKAWDAENKKSEEKAAAPPPPPGVPPAAPGEEPPEGNEKPAPGAKKPLPVAEDPIPVKGNKPGKPRTDALAGGAFPGDLTYVEPALYQQALAEAGSKFRALNASYAQAYVRSRYKQLLAETQRNAAGEGLVEIGPDGELIGPCIGDIGRCLPSSQAGRMSPLERLSAVTSTAIMVR